MNINVKSLLHDHHGQSHIHPVSFFARLDARAVLIAWLFYTIALVSIPRFNLACVIVFSGPLLFIITFTGIKIRPLLKRIAYVSPFIIMSAIANPILDRRHFMDLAGFPISAGMISGLTIILKSSISILSILTISSSMPFDHICHALRRLKVPEAFTTQLLLLHRYSFVLAEEANAMRRARDLRSFDGRGKSFSVTAILIGALFMRSSVRAARIHDAMVSRGFSGSIACCQANHTFNLADAFFLSGSVVVCIILRSIFQA